VGRSAGELNAEEERAGSLAPLGEGPCAHSTGGAGGEKARLSFLQRQRYEVEGRGIRVRVVFESIAGCDSRGRVREAAGRGGGPAGARRQTK